MAAEIFDDRRTKPDRRQQHLSKRIPTSGCRRRLERRCPSQRYDHRPWWLRIGYAETIGGNRVSTPPTTIGRTPPTLDDRVTLHPLSINGQRKRP